MRNLVNFAFLMFLILTATPPPASTQGLFGSDSHNGFDVSHTLIPKDEIVGGGPPKNGIPAILEPRFEAAKSATWLKDDDLVAGVDYGGVQKAYPLRILVWHEAANDEVSGVPIVMTYCPLCGSTVAFERKVNRKTLTFGISGLLYQSDVLLYDHESESLWSQLEMKAVTGKMMGEQLKLFPSVLATWKEWKKRHPNTLVLSRDTGFFRDYGRDPYREYEGSRSVWFPIKRKSNRFHPKEKVLVVFSGDIAKAYPFSELKKAKAPLEDKIGDKKVVIHFEKGDYVNATDSEGNSIPSLVAYWFAWYTFRPDTLVFQPISH